MPYIVLFIIILSIVALFVVLNSSDNQKQERHFERYDEKKRFGDKGEIETTQMLEWELPAGYTVIPNIILNYAGGTSEMDNVVVGRTGVFVIEVKSDKGTIVGDCDKYDWKQYKTDAYGNDFIKTINNPVKQVGTHVWRLKEYLKDNGIRTWINKAVYFTVPDASYRIEGISEDCPVFTYKTRKELISYIKNGTANLSDETVKKIVNLLQ